MQMNIERNWMHYQTDHEPLNVCFLEDISLESKHDPVYVTNFELYTISQDRC